MWLDLEPTRQKLSSMLDGFLAALPNLVIGLLLLVIAYIIGRVVRTSVRRIVRASEREAYAALILGRLAQWLVVTIGVIVSLSVVFPSVSAQDLIGILGLSSIAIGFAFRDIAQNFLAGILLLITRPFRIGDQIIVAEFEGTVEDIETRATHIRTYDGRAVVIPNAVLFTQSVTVNTADELRRSEYDFGIAYGDDVELAKRIALEAVASVPEVQTVPAPDTLLVDLSDYTVNLRVRWWTASERQVVLRARDRVLIEVKRRFESAGISFPFPIQTVLHGDPNGIKDAPRRRVEAG